MATVIDDRKDWHECLRRQMKHPGKNHDQKDHGNRSGRTVAASVSWRSKAEPADFIEARDKSKFAEFLSHIEPSDIKDHKLFLSEDGTVGAAVSPDGDIQNVFNNGGPKGGGNEALLAAVNAGGKTLDCYDQFLPGLYANFGFTETGRMKFNREYAPPTWDYDRFGEPDVVFMARTNFETDSEIREKAYDKSKWKAPKASDQYYEGDQWDDAKRDSIARADSSRSGTDSGKETDGTRAKSLDRTSGSDRRFVGWPESLALAAQRKSSVNEPDETIAAGLAVMAEDTGRVLLLQRALDDDDPASGKLEFAGGHLEDGEDSFDAAVREWSEETGLQLPDGRIAGWYKDGIYEAYFWLIESESDLDINPSHDDREVENPDNVDGEYSETAIWFDVLDMVDNPIIRSELLDAMDDVLRETLRIMRSEPQTKAIGMNTFTGELGGSVVNANDTQQKCGTDDDCECKDDSEPIMKAIAPLDELSERLERLWSELEANGELDELSDDVLALLKLVDESVVDEIAKAVESPIKKAKSNCGANAEGGGGFQKGNKCAGDGDKLSSSDLPSVNREGKPKEGTEFVANQIPFFDNEPKMERELYREIKEFGGNANEYIDLFATEETIDLSSIKSGQKIIERSNLKYFENGGGSDKLPLVIQYGDDMVVRDGNHRLAAKIMNGEEKAKARVLYVSGS